MPQLPSGRHYCIGRDPLIHLLERMKVETFINDLLVIERREDLYPYLELMYLREDTSIETPTYAPGSLPISADLKTFPSGYTLATMKPEIESWPQNDQIAFFEFMESERFIKYLDETLAMIQTTKRELIDDPRFVVRCQAAFWLGGVHPLQVDD